MKKCPFCAEEIQEAAIVCKHCGREVNKPLTSSSPSHENKQGLTVTDGVKTGCGMFIVLPLIIIGILFLLLVLGALGNKCNAQANHIGKPMDSVYSFYVKAVGKDFVWRFDSKKYLTVTDAGSPPLNVVECFFDSSLNCTEHLYYVQGDENLKKYTSKLNNNKSLKYDASKKEWLEKAGKYRWWWEHKYETLHYLHCAKL